MCEWEVPEILAVDVHILINDEAQTALYGLPMIEADNHKVATIKLQKFCVAIANERSNNLVRPYWRLNGDVRVA